MLNYNKILLYNNLIDLLEYSKILFDEETSLLINKRIQFYNEEKIKANLEINYLWLKFIDWRYYKRLVFKKLRNQRLTKDDSYNNHY